jgi:transcription termination factor 2
MIKSRRMRWAGHVTRMGQMRNFYKVLVGKTDGKRPLGIPRRRWKDNIKMYLRKIGLEGVDWIHVAEDRDRWRGLANTIMNLRVP